MPEETEQLETTQPATEPVAEKKVWKRVIDIGDGAGVQVFEADSPEALLDKLTKAQENATRHIRTLNKRIKVGDEGEPDKEKRFEFKPKKLNAGEEWQIGTNISDPSKAAAAVRQLFESEIGATPEELREVVNEARENARAVRAKAEADEFIDGQPDYYPCPENVTILMRYLEKNGYSITKKNLDIAYGDLSEAGLLKTKPVEPPPPTPVVETEQAATRPRRTSATGILPENASRGVAVKSGPSQAEIAKMSSDEYYQRIVLPEMRARRGR